MQETDQEHTIDLRHYLVLLRHRKWSLILTTLTVVGVVLVGSYFQTPIFTGEARILVDPIPSGAEGTLVEPTNVQTEAQVIASQPVAARVRNVLDLSISPEVLQENLEVNPITETEVVSLKYSSTSPRLARDVTNAFGEAYISYTREKALEDTLAARQTVQNRISQVTQRIEELSAQLSEARRADDGALTTTLETQRTALISRLGLLQQDLDEASPGTSVRGGGEIIESASLPESPSSPDYVTNVALALVVGLALGLGLALLRERLDDRFRGRSDIEKITGVPVLATIPQYPEPKRGESSLITRSKPSSVPSEAYRSLRTNLQFLTGQRKLRSILVTSASSGEGKTVTTANLGIALAQARQRVILVSADLRKPTLEEHFDLDRRQIKSGLSTWLSGQEDDLWKTLHDPGTPNIRVIPSGPIPPNPAELLTSSRLVDLIRELEEVSDIVLIDSPPVLPIADTLTLSTRSAGTLLVISADAARSASIRAKEELERVGGIVIGSVLNAFDPSAAPYGYYGGYGYYYGGYTAAEPGVLNGATDTPERKSPAPKKSRLFGLRR